MPSADMMLHHRTPDVTIFDNRGLAVRDLQYYRHPDTIETTKELLTHHVFSAVGQLQGSADPRLGSAGLTNMTRLASLSGKPLLVTGVDNGTVLTLHDIADRPHKIVTAQGTIRTPAYENRSLPGRILSLTEQTPGNDAHITTRYVYAGDTEEEQAFNLVGQAVRHYDSVGLIVTNSIAINGTPLSVVRKLMLGSDNPDSVSNWLGGDSAEWDTLLSDENYITNTTTNAIGDVQTILDATGNLQRIAYDISGQPCANWLTLKGGQEQIILKSLTYSAAGQKLREEHGNGVITTYNYDSHTQHLTGIRTERPAEHAFGAKIFQDLRYEYDFVGNVLSVYNDAEDIRFWRNQKVAPENRYRYDSLYRLVSANGREMANEIKRINTLSLHAFFDDVTYTNYTRVYTYDDGDNLISMRHSAPATGNNYTLNFTISNRSNRGVSSTLTEDTSIVDNLFTAGGHQLTLEPGLQLAWTSRGELRQVVSISDQETPDREHYRYDDHNQRVLKVSNQHTTLEQQRVLYLPGLELRTFVKEGVVSAFLQVVIMGNVGRAQTRVLYWDMGKPADIDNNQIRYSYGDLVGSCGLEIDGDGNIISQEEYYPYGGTAVWAARSQREADYKTVRYSGKERDATGLYYYGYRYYQPWAGRWLSADPAGTVDGLNLFRMVRNNPVTFNDPIGLAPDDIDMEALSSGLKKMGLTPSSEVADLLKGIKKLAPKYRQPQNLVAKFRSGSMASSKPSVSSVPQASNAGGFNKEQMEGIMHLYGTNVGAQAINAITRKHYGLESIHIPEISSLARSAHNEYTRSHANSSYVFPVKQAKHAQAVMEHGDTILLMSSALASQGKMNAAHYLRGTRQTAELDRLKNGDVVKAGFFMSVTKSHRTAVKFARGKYSDEQVPGVYYEIIGNPYKFSGGEASEDEGVFNAGIYFRFDGIANNTYQFTELGTKRPKGTSAKLLYS